ncbi:hypothetical protein CK503_10220 [Aliifodinibius salipaludis]|uniref:Sulfotransferase domain-containing protein n=1 Tax=Fodinibius salipaludis TaxID=2032627 RepID=A0A2A2GA43_9BACT|nr:hypothetical protein [Aliifodinibius salipaludis]PAU94030.1 hypothetical protein CK503_10220 [Aliifodinibius salipaludis]
MEYRRFLSWFKHLVSSNVLLYKIWFHSVRKWRGDYVRLPTKNDDFYFDGYPRSGNTFFAALFSKVYLNKSFASHLHVISGLKIALILKLPIFVMVRRPEDAIISNLYRKVVGNDVSPDRDLFEMLLVSYYNYYLFVKKNIRKINVIRFETSIENEVLLTKKIAEELGFEVQLDDSLTEMLSDYKEMMQKKEAQKESHASSLPNENRARFKTEYLNKVLNSPSYSMAETIYNELISYDLLSE